MFILHTSVPGAGHSEHKPGVSPVKKTDATSNEDNESTTQYRDVAGDGYDGAIENRESPFAQVVSVQRQPGGRQIPPKPEHSSCDERQELASRISGLPQDSRQIEIIDNLFSNENVRNCHGQIRLVPGRQISPEARENRVSQFIQSALEQGVINENEQKLLEELLEFEKARIERNKAAQELDMVLTLMSTASPEIGLRSLKGIVGYLHDPTAISVANSGISQLASWAIEEGIKLARRTGDTSLIKQVASDLNSGFGHVGHTEEGHNQGAVGGIPDEHTHADTVSYQETAEPVYAVDQEGNILGVAYYEYYYEPVHTLEEHEAAHSDAERTVSGAYLDANSGVHRAEQEKNKKDTEVKMASSARDTLGRLDEQERSINDPLSRTQISIEKSEANRTIGLA